jgi:hypothetical protein
MLNKLSKKILYQQDVAEIVPNLDLLKLINRDIAQKIETTIFDGEKTMLWIITTNTYPNQLKQLLDNL